MSLRRVTWYALAVSISCVVTASPAHGQSFREVQSGLFQDVILIHRGTSGVDLSTAFLGVERNLVLVSSALEHALASEPLPSMSGGLVFGLKEDGSGRARVNTALSTDLLESARTVGRKSGILAIHYARHSYNRLQNVNLADGVVTYYRHADCCTPSGSAVPTPAYEGDVLEISSAFRITSDVINISATYGMFSWLDLGIVVPIRRLSADMTFSGRIHRLATSATPGIHQYDASGADQKTVSGSSSSTGLGEIVVRGKLGLIQRERIALAMGGDLRTRSSNPDLTLGTGASQGRIYTMASFAAGRSALHTNAGYTFPILRAEASRRNIDLSSAADYAVAFDRQLSRRVSVGGGLTGRSISATAAYGSLTEDYTFFPNGDETGTPQTLALTANVVARQDPVTRQMLTTRRHLARAVVTARVMATGRILLTANVTRFVVASGLTTGGVAASFGLHTGF